jgi:methionyl-tRNA formyltransferase
LRILFVGTPEFAVPPLKALVQHHLEVVAVYTQPDRPAGRGRMMVFSPVKKVALDFGLPVVQPVNLKDPVEVFKIADFQPDAIVVAAYGKVIPPPVLDIPPYGCLNIHPSLLPRFRGASPVAAAILEGEAFTGVSIMLLDRGLDTGPVLAQEKVEILPEDTAGLLSARLSERGARMLPDVLLGWSRGDISSQPQNEAEASYTAPLSKEEGEIDWRLSAVAIWRRVRAFQPWPGAYTRWDGRRLELVEAMPLPKHEPLPEGTVVALPEDGAPFGVSTGDGILGVLKVQLEGKRAMPAADFLRGQRQFIGAVLPSD